MVEIVIQKILPVYVPAVSSDKLCPEFGGDGTEAG